MDDTNRMQRVELRLDVNGSIALSGPLEIAATVFLPPADALGEAALAVFALPGGGYSRGYYDLEFEGHRGYSQAQYQARRGSVFIAVDHLGVGASSTAHLDRLRVEDIAAANDSAVRQVADRLRQGGLVPGYPALPRLCCVGIGQSMGGCITVIMQARHRTYEAIGVLGYSAIHTALPQPDEAAFRAGLSGGGRDAGREADVSRLSLQQASVRTANYVYPFHWEDVPRDILDADMAGGYPIRSQPPPWGSATLPNCAIAMMSPGFIKAEAAAVDVPVFIGLGKRDIAMNPHSEPAAYPLSCDVTLQVVPRMAHMHNFASTRGLLWQRLGDWMESVSRNEAQAAGLVRRGFGEASYRRAP